MCYQLATFLGSNQLGICLLANFTAHMTATWRPLFTYDLGLNPGQPIFYLLLPIYGLMG